MIKSYKNYPNNEKITAKQKAAEIIADGISVRIEHWVGASVSYAEDMTEREKDLVRYQLEQYANRIEKILKEEIYIYKEYTEARQVLERILKSKSYTLYRYWKELDEQYREHVEYSIHYLGAEESKAEVIDYNRGEQSGLRQALQLLEHALNLDYEQSYYFRQACKRLYD